MPETVPTSSQGRPPIGEILVIAPNFKRRLSGVTSTLERIVPVLARKIGIAVIGPGLTADLPRLRWRDLACLWSRPQLRPTRIWHARRNVEMLAGIVLRDLLRMKLSLVFTSASQRRHTGWSQFLIGRMDAVVATSALGAGYLHRPSTVVMHGIDAEAFHPADDPAEIRGRLGLPELRLVGCFGRIRAQKGTDVFVDAMMRVLPDYPGWGAVVLGRATDEHRGFLTALRGRVDAAGLRGRIVFADEVAPGATPDWYRALDLFVAPQRWEGFGVTPLEAMATELPVVATRVGAFADLVVDDGAQGTGSLIPPGDVDAMVAAVRPYLSDTDLRRATAAAGRRRVRTQFTLEREADGLIAVYEAVWAART